MPETQPRALQKRRPWRTTEVEGAGDSAVFVKRFHDARWPGRWFGRWRDRARARRERQNLERMARAGLPVPQLLGIVETPAGVELRTRWIAGAVTLAEMLARSAPTPRLARTLGTLLGGLHAAGMSHGDPHAGNVLVGPDGRAWIVDAARVDRPTPRRMSTDLGLAAALAREHTGARFRAAFLIAYLRALPEDLRANLLARHGDRRGLLEFVESAGRRLRAARVEHELDRWLRSSGVCARMREGEIEYLRVRGSAAAEVPGLARAVVRGDTPAGQRVERRGRREAVRAWLDAARLAEHGLPGPEALLLVRVPVACAVFAESPGEDLVTSAAHLGARDRRAAARAVGALAGAAADRGLILDPEAVLLRGGRDARITTAVPLARCDGAAQALSAWREAAALTSARERAAFSAGFVRAARGSRAERASLREELLRG